MMYINILVDVFFMFSLSKVGEHTHRGQINSDK